MRGNNTMLDVKKKIQYQLWFDYRAIIRVTAPPFLLQLKTEAVIECYKVAIKIPLQGSE